MVGSTNEQIYTMWDGVAGLFVLFLLEELTECEMNMLSVVYFWSFESL